MKKNTYYLSVGITLYSLSILATPTEVRAETPPALTPEATSPPNTVTITNTEHQQAIQDAQKAGLEVLEVGYKQVPSKEIAEQEMQAQTDYIQASTREYIAANKAYQTEIPRYQAYIKEQEAFQKDSVEYAQYEVKERQYQAELAHYQEQEKNYQKEVEQYEKDQASNLFLQEEFEKQEKQYQKEQAIYQENLAHYEASKKEVALITADYQRKVENYQIEKIRYDKAKEAYDAEVLEAEKHKKTDGYLSQVSAQYLISRSEPNATVRFEGVDTFIAPSHQFGAGLSGIGGKTSDLPVSHTPTLFRGVGAATAAKAGDGYGLILEKGKPITVIYSGLEQTSYDGQKISKLVYTYELTSTFASDNRASAFIYTDPTKTIYTGTSGQNKGLVDFNIRQTMTYYLENGEKVHFKEDAPALLSFASRNNTFEFGEQEYVRLHKGMTFIPISGSSVTGEEGYVASRGSNNTIADGSRFNRGDWDNDGHPNEYYGAGVAQVIGDTISFDFGIRYSQANIQRSHQPLHLRPGSRQWFTVNADIKAKGILNSKPGNPPVLPQEPSLPSLPLKPIAPIKPTPPIYRPVRKPSPPVKPVRTHTIIAKKPTRPKEVKHPTLPPIPVIFIKRIAYPTINITYGTHYRTSPPLIQEGHRIVSTSGNSTLARRTYSIPDVATIPYSSIYPVAPARQNSPNLASPPQVSPTSPAIRKNPIPHGSPAIMEKEARDSWFSENTGIRGEDKELFFLFIDELEQEARTKYGNDLAKINQHIANGIAYGNYGRKGLQPKVADVGEEPKNKDALELMDKIHQEDDFKIDFPHLAAPLATASQSSLKKEALKTVLGLNFGMAFGVLPSDVFFQANSWLGDTLTTMNEKDKVTDKDAFILHTIFSNIPLNEAIKRYYSIPNLDQKREQLYQAALRFKYPTLPNPELMLKASALLSLSTLGLITVFHILSPLKNRWDELKGKWNKFKGKIKDYWEKFSKKQGQQKSGEKAPIHKSDKKPSPRLTSNKQGQAKTSKPANRFSLIARTFNPKKILISAKQAVKPIATTIQKKVVQPIKNGIKHVGKVIEPIKRAIKPVAKAVQKKVIQPIKTGIKHIRKVIQKKVVQPVKQAIKPVAKAVQKKGIQPIKRGINKTRKTIQKKVVQPIKRATKPIAKTIQKRVVQPVKRAIRKVTAPIQRKIIRPVRQANRPVRRPIQRKAPKPIQRRPIRKPAKKKGR